jgi:hypothetical protein
MSNASPNNVHSKLIKVENKKRRKEKKKKEWYITYTQTN